jgi:hypothetical protein
LSFQRDQHRRSSSVRAEEPCRAPVGSGVGDQAEKPKKEKDTRQARRFCHDCDKAQPSASGRAAQVLYAYTGHGGRRGETASCAKSKPASATTTRTASAPTTRRRLRLHAGHLRRSGCNRAPKYGIGEGAPLLLRSARGPGHGQESGRPGPAPVHGASDARDPRQACNLCQSKPVTSRSPRKRCTQEVTCIDFATPGPRPLVASLRLTASPAKRTTPA